jgi:hypothetical protein
VRLIPRTLAIAAGPALIFHHAVAIDPRLVLGIHLPAQLRIGNAPGNPSAWRWWRTSFSNGAKIASMPKKALRVDVGCRQMFHNAQ